MEEPSNKTLGIGMTDNRHAFTSCPWRIDLPGVYIEVLFVHSQADDFTDINGATGSGRLVIFIVTQEASFQNTPLFICL